MGERMTPVEELRAAAAVMRERAEGATPGPWRALCDGYGDTTYGRAEQDRRDLLWVRSGATNDGDIVSTEGMWTEESADNVRHIASWHPGVALAVADWLDKVAEDVEFSIYDKADDALAVARSYLGSAE